MMTKPKKTKTKTGAGKGNNNIEKFFPKEGGEKQQTAPRQSERLLSKNGESNVAVDNTQDDVLNGQSAQSVEVNKELMSQELFDSGAALAGNGEEREATADPVGISIEDNRENDELIDSEEEETDSENEKNEEEEEREEDDEEEGWLDADDDENIEKNQDDQDDIEEVFGGKARRTPPSSTSASPTPSRSSLKKNKHHKGEYVSSSLVHELRESIVGVGSDVREMKATLTSEIRAVSSTVTQEKASRVALQKEVKVIRECTTNINARLVEVTKKTAELCKEIEELKAEREELKQQTVELNEGLTTLTDTVNDNDDRSRRRNLIIRGLSEANESGRRDTEDHVRWFIKDCLGIEANLDSARRIGPKIEGRARLILVEFASVKQRDEIFARKSEARFHADARKVFIEGDFCPATRQVRFKLFEKQAEMRAKGVHMVVNYKSLEAASNTSSRGRGRGGPWSGGRGREGNNNKNLNFSGADKGAHNEVQNVDEGFADETAWQEEPILCKDGMGCENENCTKSHVQSGRKTTNTQAQRSTSSIGRGRDDGTSTSSSSQLGSTSLEPSTWSYKQGRARGGQYTNPATEQKRLPGRGRGQQHQPSASASAAQSAGHSSQRSQDGMNEYFANHSNGNPYDPFAQGDERGDLISNQGGQGNSNVSGRGIMRGRGRWGNAPTQGNGSR